MPVTVALVIQSMLILQVRIVTHGEYYVQHNYVCVRIRIECHIEVSYLCLHVSCERRSDSNLRTHMTSASIREFHTKHYARVLILHECHMQSSDSTDMFTRLMRVSATV
jgi:phenylalanyl-tRNA synthetase alpha subunit